VDPGETPEQAARRELREETGLEALELTYLGNLHPDTGRVQVEAHAFYVVTPFHAPSPTCVVIISALAGTWLYGLLRPRLPH
jgi:8-oxo-dGTP pyrophosphatase MutT (NUDIX family)